MRQKAGTPGTTEPFRNSRRGIAVASKMYGASDDLIEFEGDHSGEVGFYNPGEDVKFAMVSFSDGTIAQIGYGKGELAVWQIVVLRQGDLFAGVEVCNDEDAKVYSDQLHLKDGITWAYVATEWQKAD